MFSKVTKIKDVKVEIGQLIKSYRKRDKISQQELADSLGLSRVTIQNLESGKNFTINTLLKVLQHFDLLLELNNLVKDRSDEIRNLKSLY
jgi:transcriptional regulator with XRE-family HTH domain